MAGTVTATQSALPDAGSLLSCIQRETGMHCLPSWVDVHQL